ncbi:hypothetical protein HK099_003800 [Clydaea vesicula]|uniref:BZIP domain-containing protein n=1 Tax=Clydaea vesicula TaxID=447962 RepID=A0AAD5U2V4_9FUNG|nr:hypothetical protein HK099_003800 [Clydaea vesicula]
MISNSAASTQPTDELDLLQLDPHFNQIFGDPFLPQRNLSYDNIDSFMLDEPIFASPNPNVPSSPESIFNSPPQQQLPNHFDLTAFNPNNASSLTNLMTTFTGNSMLPSLASLATNFSTSNLVSKLSNSNNFNLEINSTNSTDAVNSISSPLLMKFNNSNNINKKVEKKKKSDKRKKLTAEEREAKIQERILRNRQAAQESRDKKKEYVSNLEVTNENLSTQNVQLVELVKQSETQNQNLLSLVQSLSQELDRLKRNQSGLPPSPSPEAENLLGYGDVSSLTLPEPLNSTAHVIRNPAHSHRTAPYTLPSNNNYLSLIGSESSNKAGSCFVAVKKEPGLLTEIKTEPVSPPTSPESWTSLIERSPPPPSPSLINKEIASDAVITTLLTSLSFMALRPNSGLFARNLWSESEYGFKRNNWKKEKESLGISPRFHSILSPLKEERPLLRKRNRKNTEDLTGTLSNRRQTFYYLIALGELCKFLWKDDFKEQTAGWRYWRQRALDLRNIRDELCHNPSMSFGNPNNIYPLETDVRKNLTVLCVEKANALEELKIYLERDFLMGDTGGGNFFDKKKQVETIVGRDLRRRGLDKLIDNQEQEEKRNIIKFDSDLKTKRLKKKQREEGKKKTRI